METVHDEGLGGRPDSNIAHACQREERILVTCDLDFADIRTYPPATHPGFVVLRLARQDKPHVLDIIRQLVIVLRTESPKTRIWIVEEHRIRVRE